MCVRPCALNLWQFHLRGYCDFFSWLRCCVYCATWPDKIDCVYNLLSLCMYIHKNFYSDIRLCILSYIRPYVHRYIHIYVYNMCCWFSCLATFIMCTYTYIYACAICVCTYFCFYLQKKKFGIDIPFYVYFTYILRNFLPSVASKASDSPLIQRRCSSCHVISIDLDICAVCLCVRSFSLPAAQPTYSPNMHCIWPTNVRVRAANA